MMEVKTKVKCDHCDYEGAELVKRYSDQPYLTNEVVETYIYCPKCKSRDDNYLMDW